MATVNTMMFASVTSAIQRGVPPGAAGGKLEVELRYLKDGAGAGAGAAAAAAAQRLTDADTTRLIKVLNSASSAYKRLAGGETTTIDLIVAGTRVTYDASRLEQFRPDLPLTPESMEHSGIKRLQVMNKRKLASVDNLDHQFRIAVNVETPMQGVPTELSRRTSGAGATANGVTRLECVYRFKKRGSFVPKQNPTARIDITEVYQLSIPYGRPPPTFSDLVRQNARFEVEVELIDLSPDPLTCIRVLLRHHSNVLKIVENTQIIMSLSQRAAVIGQYQKMLALPILSASTSKFVGPKPITLEVGHLGKGLHGYAVTDKADGERQFVLIDDAGDVFTINDRMTPRKTALTARTRRSCVLDCEIVKHQHASQQLIMVFDMYVVNGKLINGQPLLDRLSAAQTTVDDIVGAGAPDATMSLAMKTFHVIKDGTLGSFSDACVDAFQTARSSPYADDGLILTPTGPVSLVRSAASASEPPNFKWKPSNQNSIDFDLLINTDAIVSLDGKLYRHVTLRVGRDALAARGPVTALDYLTGAAGEKYRSAKADRYIATPFNPPNRHGVRDPSVMLIECASSGDDGDVVVNTCRLTCENGNAIDDAGSIVECAFDTATQRWTPMRMRYDKMERRADASVKANNYKTAVNIWESIHFPITEETLRRPEKLEALVAAKLADELSSEDNTTTTYYVPTDANVLKAMRSYHNSKKRELLGLFKGGHVRSLFDIGVGRAGDLAKWREMGIDVVFGIDKSANNLNDPDPATGAAHTRLLESKEKLGDMRVVLLPMDASKDICSETYAFDNDGDKLVADVVMGRADSASVPIGLRRYHNIARKHSFPLVTCMFAVHYMFGQEADLAQFCVNVDNMISAGGHFVGCCMNGPVVEKLLRDAAVGQGVVEKSDKGEVLWSIVRKYETPSSRAAPHPMEFGRTIDVYVASIGQTVPEYLVSYDTLKNALAKHNIVPIPVSACKRLGLPAASGRFSDLGDRTTRGSMSPAEQRYSDLNLWFVFTKSESR